MWKELKAIEPNKMIIDMQRDLIDKLNELIEDQKREIDFLSGQLEAANNDLRLAQIRLENLKKYGAENPDIRDMYPNIEYHGDRLDPADYADLPFPDVEDLAPAEEVDGAND